MAIPTFTTPEVEQRIEQLSPESKRRIQRQLKRKIAQMRQDMKKYQ